MGLWEDIGNALSGAGAKLEPALKAGEKFIAVPGVPDIGPSKDEKPSPKGKSGGKGGKGGKAGKGTTGTSTANELSQLEKEIASNPYNVLGQGITKELGQADQAVQNTFAAPTQQGGATNVATGNAVNQALAEAGLSPGSSAAQWLTANVAQANQNDQPMTAALNAYSKAYGAGEQGNTAALGAMGEANALANVTAPEQQWIQGLQQHIQSNLGYYGNIPTADIQNMSPALLYYLQQAGTGGGGGAGVTPLSSIKVPGAKSNAPALPNAGTLGGATGPQTTVPRDTGTAPG